MIRSRDLSILQKLYRARQFKDTNLVISSPKECRYVLYGSMNALSSIQRRAFRNYVNNLSAFSNVKVTLTLFSGTVTQTIRGHSSLQKLDNLFQGTTYRITVSIMNKSEHIANEQLFAYLNYVIQLKFSEDIAFNFNPGIIIRVDSNHSNSRHASLLPRRFQKIAMLCNSKTIVNAQVIQHLISVISAAYSITILFLINQFRLNSING